MTWTEQRVRGVGTGAVAAAGLLGTAGLLALAYGGTTGSLPAAAPLGLGLGVAGLVAWLALVRRPVAHLTALLVCFAVLFNSEEGVQASELAFGAYYLGYLAVWLVGHVALGPGRLLRDGLDLALVAFLALVTAQAVTAPLYGGDPLLAVNQWRCALVLAFYFPIRETVRERPGALVPITAAFVAVALFLTARNLYLYASGLQSAEALYQLVFNRARMGERIYAVALLGAIAFAVRPGATAWTRMMALAVAVATAGAVVGGMSRTIWVAIVPGLVVQALVFNAQEWRAVAIVLGVTAAGLVVAVPLFVGDAFEAVVTGLSFRAGSIATSASQDLSLINRFYEWEAAARAALVSPVLGRGLGVPYRYFDILYQATVWRPFNHSTYVGVFYRHGLAGLALFLGIYSATAWRAFQMTRTETGTRRTLTVAALSAIALLSVSISTEGALLITDGAYGLMYPLAVVGGLWWSREPATS